MKRWIGATVAALAAVTLVWSGAAIAQDKSAQSKSADCAQSPSASPPSTSGAPAQPSKVEGEVIRVDPSTNRITVRSADGGVHEFTGSKDTITQYKVGDRLEATRRAPNC